MSMSEINPCEINPNAFYSFKFKMIRSQKILIHYTRVRNRDHCDNKRTESYLTRITKKIKFTTLSVLRHFFEPTSQILTVLSSDAVQISVESELQATSETPNLWPAMTASILPSIALQIRTVRSAFTRDLFQCKSFKINWLSNLIDNES